MEIAFPVEFVVAGTPVSLQAKRPSSRIEWQQKIVAGVMPCLPQNHFLSAARIAVTLYYFPGSPMGGDIDNIVKPVLDAFSRRVYFDDAQVERVVVQKFEPQRIFGFSSPSDCLRMALDCTKPVLYVRLSQEPFEDLI